MKRLKMSGPMDWIKKVKVCFYIAQKPVRWSAQSALHFSSPGGLREIKRSGCLAIHQWLSVH